MHYREDYATALVSVNQSTKPGACCFYNRVFAKRRGTMLISHRNKPKVTAVHQLLVADGAVHITFTQEGNKERALKALAALVKATKHIKPDSLNGGASAVRELRNGR